MFEGLLEIGGEPLLAVNMDPGSYYSSTVMRFHEHPLLVDWVLA